MPLDPFLEPLVATLPPFPDAVDDWPAFRAAETTSIAELAEQLVEPAPEGSSKRTVTIAVHDGEIALNVFTPETLGPHPVHLYIHGGGWVAGSIHHEVIDILCAERAVGADCIVVTPEYRKAPEHPFPTGLHDAYAALLWITDHADELGARTDALTVGGGSAGANLAAAVALKARNEDGPAIVFQLLEVPALDLTGQSPSLTRNGTGYGLDEHTINTLLPLYLPDPADARDPYASPLLASDLSGLPAAHIMAAEFDPLADDAPRYAERLNAAGVPATVNPGLGHIHGSSAYTKAMASARAWRDEAVEQLHQANRRAIGH